MARKNPLSRYHEKRDFAVTQEPRGKAGCSAAALRFVVQLHEARRTHYDLRLEWNGVMKSWAVTKGPSFDPADKRLAVRTEDHPIEYNAFEGVIPARQYGAGPVMIWDEGLWIPDDDPDKMEKKGHISFTIQGGRMKGHWHLVRMKLQEKRENWLLIKGADDHVLSAAKNDKYLQQENTSIITGRTMAQIRAAGPGNTAEKNRVQDKKAPQKAVKKKAVKKIAVKTPSMDSLLKDYQGMVLATLVEKAPDGLDWWHEIKYDGYRLMGFINNGEVILRTRGVKDWTHKFAPLAAALGKLKVQSAILDLEACVLDDEGRTSFSLLQEALSAEDPATIEGWVFDLLHLDGKDYRGLPLSERKERLERLLKNTKSPLHYSAHFESAPDLLSQACKVGAEGLVSKRKDSLYRGRRGRDWVKSKCGLAQEFVIGGFMPAKDNDKAIGALLLGYYKNGKFLYAGKVGTGFSRKLAVDIYKKLVPLAQDQSPFPVKPPRGRRKYIFVAPKILCEVSFLQWTADGHIRHASFKGLRMDKKPADVKEEIPVKINGKKSKGKKGKNEGFIISDVTISNADREVFPGTGITKGDVAQYYEQVAPLIMSSMKGRLISLLRCTDGIKGECFFQRNPMRGMGDRVKALPVTHKGKKHTYLYIEDDKGLLQLVQMGTIEFHGWQSTVKNKGKPDQIIFDLDPDPSVPFEAVKLAALDIHARLKKRGLKSFARLSGGKGIHVVIPIKPRHDWEKIKEYARDFAEMMVRATPDVYVATMSKKRREGKIFIDFFRNDFSSTAIMPFSIRARDGAPLAWPLSWAALQKIDNAAAFRLNDINPTMLSQAARQEQEFQKARQELRLE